MCRQERRCRRRTRRWHTQRKPALWRRAARRSKRARQLRDGVEALELTSKFTLAVLALASGVYTYLGVRDLLDGSATVVFLGAFIYSAAVSVGIYAFWTFLLRLMPHVRHTPHRIAL